MQVINVTTGTYPLVLGDDILAMNTAKIYLQCQTSGGAINILLPKITIPAGGSISNWWFEVFINDADGNAATNNITITPNPANTINGSVTAVVLNVSGSTARLNVTGSSSWELNVNSNGKSSSIPSLTTIQREALIPVTPFIAYDSDLDAYYKWSTFSQSWSPF